MASGIYSPVVRGLLTVVASRTLARGEQASEVAEVAHGLSCSSACGIFLAQGLSLCLVAVEVWHLSHWATREATLWILNKGERQGRLILHPCEVFLPPIQNARWHKAYVRVPSF